MTPKFQSNVLQVSWVVDMGDSLHILALLLVLLAAHRVISKVFTRCELVRELSQPKHRIPAAEVATWVCIARHESEYNTSAIGNLNADGSGDHGLFQISDQYWCSPPGVGLACGLNCDQLEDDDIKDDVVCARRIYRATKRRMGDGFTAWAVYGPHCRGDVSSYTEGCDEQDTTSTSTTENYWSRTTSTTEKPIEEVSSTTEEAFIDEISEELTSESNTEDRNVRLFPSSKLQSSLEFSRKMMPHYFQTKYQNTLAERRQFEKSSVDKPVGTYRGATAVDSRISGTSSSTYRPTFIDPGLDPATAWLKIHNDPRFLNEYP